MSTCYRAVSAFLAVGSAMGMYHPELSKIQGDLSHLLAAVEKSNASPAKKMRVEEDVIHFRQDLEMKNVELEKRKSGLPYQLHKDECQESKELFDGVTIHMKGWTNGHIINEAEREVSWITDAIMNEFEKWATEVGTTLNAALHGVSKLTIVWDGDGMAPDSFTVFIEALSTIAEKNGLEVIFVGLNRGSTSPTNNYSGDFGYIPPEHKLPDFMRGRTHFCFGFGDGKGEYSYFDLGTDGAAMTGAQYFFFGGGGLIALEEKQVLEARGKTILSLNEHLKSVGLPSLRRDTVASNGTTKKLLKAAGKTDDDIAAHGKNYWSTKEPGLEGEENSQV